MSNDANHPVSLNIAVLTISDSRTLTDDKSGATLAELIAGDGHKLADRRLVRDDLGAIQQIVQYWIADPGVDVVLTTGGTGLTGRDVTPEALQPLFDKNIPGFGELFRWLSYQKIGPATIQSRALAGIAGGTYIFALPGSTSACRDAWDMILRHQFDSRSKPCSFINIMPRLKE
jgi:molybdenum cofactor biosynthesis protein B